MTRLLCIAALLPAVDTAQAQQSRGVILEPFVATQIVPGDRPTTVLADGCRSGWMRLSNRIGVRATGAPLRTVPRLVIDGSLSFNVSPPFDCPAIPQPTGPLPGVPFTTAVGLGDGRGAFGLLRMGVRAFERRHATGILGAGLGVMFGASQPFGTAGGHLAVGGSALRATIGVDGFATRALVRTETLVQVGNGSEVRRSETSHTQYGALLRVGFTFPVP
ncbi:MAG: hypothetical protein MUF00_13755 [Gemmatimonadaceae bacterium]|jgi:hypothetical protein|nr:hypothetical protein [Gemmatimonadaceae bacterium]